METVVKPQEKILGKFDTPEARDTALTEIHKKVMGEDVPVPTYADDEAKNKAYTAYERVMKQPKEEKKQPVVQPTTTDNPLQIGVGDDDPDVDGILAKAGLNAAEVTKQWTEKGELTAEQYAALKKVGYGRKLADTIATGQHARAVLSVQQNTAIRNEAVEAVGGEEAFKNLNLWAEQNLDKARIEELNGIVKDRPKAYPEVMRMLKMEHATALGAGKAKPLVTGSADGTPPAITTWKEVDALGTRAAKGDKEAIAQLARITPEMKSKLK